MSRIERLKDEVCYVVIDHDLCLMSDLLLGHANASSHLWSCRRPDIEVLHRPSRCGQNPAAATDAFPE